MSNISYFFWLGIIQLIRLTWQDFKNNKFVDDRINYLMIGLAISLTSHYRVRILYYIGLILFFILVTFIFTKIPERAFGKADTNTLRWIMLGLGIIHPGVLVFYLIIFTILTLLFLLLKRLGEKFFKLEENTPIQFYPVLLLSFIMIALIYGFF